MATNVDLAYIGTNSGTAAASVSASWQADDWVIVGGSLGGGNRTLNAPTATGLTFVEIEMLDDDNVIHAVSAFWAAQASAVGSTVSVDLTSDADLIRIYVWRARGASAVELLTSAHTDTPAAFASQSVGDGDAILYLLTEWDAVTPTAEILAGTGTATEWEDGVDAGAFGYYAGGWVEAVAGSYTFGADDYSAVGHTAHILVRALPAPSQLSTAARPYSSRPANRAILAL